MNKASIPNKFREPDSKDYRRTTFRSAQIPYGMPKETCLACGTVFDPPWLEKCEPLTPVEANDGRVWVRQSTYLKCPTCGEMVEHLLPIVKQTAKYGFFGDEAYRDVNGKLISTLSIVGTNHQRIQSAEDAVLSFKRFLVPEVEPDSWVLHATEFRSGQKRKKHLIFREWSERRVAECIDGLFKLIQSFDDGFRVINSSGVVHKPAKRSDLAPVSTYLKEQVYVALLESTVDIATKNTVMPYFVFDADKDSSEEDIVHGWARDVYLGSHQSLLYAHISHGIRIPEPQFVKPASRPLLELADFVSYVVARYLFCRINRQSIDLDPKRLGSVNYIGFDRYGNCESTGFNQVGYPWSRFFESK